MTKFVPYLFIFFLSCADDPDPTIGETVEAYVNKLESFGTRQYQLDGNDKARDWIFAKLIEFGYTITEKQEFTFAGQVCHNIIATKEGNLFKDKHILVGAHYDSRAETNSNQDTKAPGANDNASGVAVVLDIARELANTKTEYTIKFIFWDAEEVNLQGSKYYVSQMGNEEVVFYLNLDEIGGYNSIGNTIVCEEDRGNASSANDLPSQQLNLELEQHMKNAGLQTKRDRIYGSDYMSFEPKGIVTIGLYENPETPHYHKSTDLAKYVDFDFLRKVSRGVFQFVLAEAE